MTRRAVPAVYAFGSALALSACGVKTAPVVRPADSPRAALIEDIKAFQETLGVATTGNFLEVSDTAVAARCYFTGPLELPVSYRGLQLRQESKEQCEARQGEYDVFFYPVEVVASGRAAITPALADATVERVLVVVPHEDFHNQPEARRATPEVAEAAATLVGFLTAREFAKHEYGAESNRFQRLDRDAGLFLRKSEVVNRYYDEVHNVYESFRSGSITRDEALGKKAELFSTLQRDCLAIAPDPASFNKCPAAMNNAGLAFDRTYTQHYSMMFDVYKQAGEDTKATIAQLRQLLANMPQEP